MQKIADRRGGGERKMKPPRSQLKGLSVFAPSSREIMMTEDRDLSNVHDAGSNYILVFETGHTYAFFFFSTLFCFF